MLLKIRFAQIFDCFIFQRRPIRMQYGETRISVKQFGSGSDAELLSVWSGIKLF